MDLHNKIEKLKNKVEELTLMREEHCTYQQKMETVLGKEDNI